MPAMDHEASTKRGPFGWIARWRGMRRLGILGINQRNAECILDLNPRSGYPIVDNKQKMRDLCLRIGVPTPALYGCVQTHSALRTLPKLLAGNDEFVIKPNRGTGGRGVLVIGGRQGQTFLRHDGRPIEEFDLRQHVSSIISGLFSLGGLPDEALLQKRVKLHAAFAGLAQNGIPDVRIILYHRVPAMAMLRLPTRQSAGRANLHQGGVGVGVDLESGVTSRAVCQNRLIDRHPDTGAALVGFMVPHWQDMLRMAIKVAEAIPLGYLGMDIVLDRDEGPLLLESNARPGLAIQIANGQGLLPKLEAIRRELARSESDSSACGACPT